MNQRDGEDFSGRSEVAKREQSEGFLLKRKKATRGKGRRMKREQRVVGFKIEGKTKAWARFIISL